MLDGYTEAQPAATVDAVADTPSTVQGAELRSFVERYERKQAEKKDIADEEKEIIAELRGRGYMVGPFRKLVKIRAQDPDKRAEEDAILEVYMAALGM